MTLLLPDGEVVYAGGDAGGIQVGQVIQLVSADAERWAEVVEAPFLRVFPGTVKESVWFVKCREIESRGFFEGKW